MSFGAFQQIKFLLQLCGAHFFQILFQALQPLFDLTQITDHKVEFDVPDVAQGIDGSDMRDRRIFEGAHDVGERVHIAQVADVGSFF